MVTLLERHGHEVLTASTGAQGITLARQEQPDIVLMDVVMPEMNGFQATREITRGEQTRQIPVVIVSAKNQETDRVWGERQGARGYLAKPVSEKDLIAALAELLEAGA